ncbi:MAG: YigZ family protein [Flavobacteriaceae bacterium]
MLEEKDTYKTIEIPSEEVLYKEKNSKFFGYCFPVHSEEEVKLILDKIKKQHFSARHWCYAFQLGTEQVHYRANDDGEPSGSAGLPIYGQIQSFELTNILVVVVRYFGGVKLGVGGLVTAYKETTKMALENAQIIEKTIDIHYTIGFEYREMNRVMRVIKEKNLNIIGQKLEMDCQIEIAVRKKEAQQVFDIFQAMYEVKISEKE